MTDRSFDDYVDQRLEAHRAELEAAYQRTFDRFGGPAEAGDVDATLTLALTHEMRGDNDEAVRWWERAAEYGSGAAASALTVVFEDLGDHVRAEHWRARSAELGLETPKAIHDYATFLGVRGRGEERNALFHQAAEAGDVASMRALGEYAADRGDLAAAETWFRRAFEAGDTNAGFELGEVLVARDDLEGARHWSRQAAERGDVQAMYLLSRITDDQEEWQLWLRRAAEAGHPDAREDLDELS